MLSVTIDPKTGSLEFPELGVKVKRFEKWADFPEPLRAQFNQPFNPGGEFDWRQLSPVQLQGHPVQMGFAFRHDALELVTLALLIKESPVRATAEEAEEEARVLRDALEKQLGVSLPGGHGEFSWGETYAYFSERDLEASAGLDYTHFSR